MTDRRSRGIFILSIQSRYRPRMCRRDKFNSHSSRRSRCAFPRRREEGRHGWWNGKRRRKRKRRATCARIVKTSINARAADHVIRRSENEEDEVHREGASTVRICWFTDRARAAGRVYIIIPDAGYTYLYKEGFTCCGCARARVSATVSLWLIATL